MIVTVVNVVSSAILLLVAYEVFSVFSALSGPMGMGNKELAGLYGVLSFVFWNGAGTFCVCSSLAIYIRASGILVLHVFQGNLETKQIPHMKIYKTSRLVS